MQQTDRQSVIGGVVTPYLTIGKRFILPMSLLKFDEVNDLRKQITKMEEFHMYHPRLSIMELMDLSEMKIA